MSRVLGRSSGTGYLAAAALVLSVIAADAAGTTGPDGSSASAPEDLVAGRTYPKWAITGFIGLSASDSDLHELVVQPWLADGEYGFAAVALSREVARFHEAFSIEVEVGVGGRFGTGYDAAEGWLAAYLRYDGFPWNDVVRTTVAVSTGVDLVSRLPPDEVAEEDTSRVLHYFSPEITFALPDNPDNELVVRWHHRSGVFGTFDGVRGGSNVVALGLRHRW
jgi:hypothetical protein